MNQNYFIATIVFVMFASFSLQAQSIVSGSNLNIGSNNTITLQNNDARGNAIGQNHWLEGFHSLVVGNNDTILSPNMGATMSSIALGGLNRICGSGSMAFGNNIKIQGNCNIGLGNELKVIAQNGVVIGNGILGNSLNPSVFLENNNDNTLFIGFHSSKPTLTISTSPNDYPIGSNFDLTGKIAIGDVPMPDIAAKLHIRSDIGEDAGLILEPKDPEISNTFIRLRDEYHGIEVDKDGITTIKSLSTDYNGFETNNPLLLKGTVGINITNNHINDLSNNYSLWVMGGIITEKVTIKYRAEWWPDYVFSPDYQLMPIKELRNYISKNQHLPEVPAETEVMEDGIELGDMQGVLLRKIEELTLYMLQQQETIEHLERRIAELEK